ncbi:MAG: MlaC/ttg2D family ABC transporter substrate-binding protein [Planktomarina sp.]
MISRRLFLGGTAALCVAQPVFAVSPAGAEQFVTRVADEIMSIVKSGSSQSSVAGKFNKMIGRYGDMPVISRSALGPASRSASGSDLSAFSKAFQGYVARKYSQQFAEFKDGSIKIKSSKDRGRFVEVQAQIIRPGKAAINVDFRVWDKSGSTKFIDILIEGISLITTERAEMGALLDQRGGSISKLAKDLNGMG